MKDNVNYGGEVNIGGIDQASVMGAFSESVSKTGRVAGVTQ